MSTELSSALLSFFILKPRKKITPTPRFSPPLVHSLQSSHTLRAPSSSRKFRWLNPAAATTSNRARIALGARFLCCGGRFPPMAKAMSYPQQRSWSDIPLELAGLVLRRLFAKVPLAPPLPLPALADGTVYSFPGSKPFCFPGCVGFVGACGKWLVFSSEDGFFLRDPFSNALLTLPAPCRARVRCNAPGYEWRESQNAKDLTLSGVIFCSAHLIVALVMFQEIPRIAMCQPSATSWWSVHVDDGTPAFVDIICHQGRIYALDTHKDGLFTIDVCIDHSTSDPWVSQIRRVINGIPGISGIGIPGMSGLIFTRDFDFSIKAPYLVELHGRLLMVQRNVYGRLRIERGGVITTGQNEFEVFEADVNGSQWTKVTSIGDDQYEMRGDRIIFFENDDDDIHWNNEESTSSCRVYNMRDGVSSALQMVSWKRGTKRNKITPRFSIVRSQQEKEKKVQPSSLMSRRLNPSAATASIRAPTALGHGSPPFPYVHLSSLQLLFVLAPRVAHERLAQPMAKATLYLRQRSWSDIPLELAGLVLCRLPAKRSAAQQVPLPPPLPLVALPDGTTYSLPSSEELHFPDCAGYIGACGNWGTFYYGCFLELGPIASSHEDWIFNFMDLHGSWASMRFAGSSKSPVGEPSSEAMEM
ncbi:hypothetical protein EJB05_26832, partial [Eragrostis curvula]